VNPAVRIALAVLLLIAAASAQQPGAPASAKAPATAPAAVTPDYVIGPDDILHIVVWREQEMTTTLPVRPDGKIALPLIGEVEAAGKTPAALQELLTAKAEKYVNNPQVTVMVTDVRSKRVFVLGEVLRPGSFTLSPGMTALQAITAAGGLSQYANSRKIFVLRKEGNTPVRLHFNYQGVISGRDLNADLPLRAGDTIIVR
jgi:polysaccharide export outer membrane protein